MGQVWIDRTCAVTKQSREVMHFSRLAALKDHCDRSSLLRAYKMLLKPGHGQKGRDRHMILIHITVCQNQDIRAFADYSVHLDEEILDGFFKACVLIIGNRNFRHLESFHFHIFDFQEVCIRKNRVVYPEHLTVLFLFLKQVPVFSDIDHCGSYDLLTDRVDRRVRNLGEKLFKITKQRLPLLRKHRKRNINSHGRDPFSSVFRHSKDRSLHILISITKRLLQAGALFFCIFRYILVRNRKIFQLNQIAVQPLAVWFFVSIFFFQFLIVNHSSRNRIHKKHLARMQSFLHEDFGRIDVKHTDL